MTGARRRLAVLRLIPFGLVLVGVLAVAAGRELTQGARALADCDAARALGDQPEAVAAAKRAAEAVVPGSATATHGFERLAELGRDAERRGDEATAAAAWHAMRAAALATRAIGHDTGEWRTLSDEGLVRVAAQVARGTPANPPAANAPTESALRAALASDDTPSTWYFVVIAGGSIAFITLVRHLFWVLTRIQLRHEMSE